jgi:hypothetical protein
MHVIRQAGSARPETNLHQMGGAKQTAPSEDCNERGVQRRNVAHPASIAASLRHSLFAAPQNALCKVHVGHDVLASNADEPQSRDVVDLTEPIHVHDE